MGFENPLPLNIETITKLAPGIDPEMSSFAISKSDTNDDLLLCGVVSFSRPKNRFNEIPGQIGNLRMADAFVPESCTDNIENL